MRCFSIIELWLLFITWLCVKNPFFSYHFNLRFQSYVLYKDLKECVIFQSSTFWPCAGVQGLILRSYHSKQYLFRFRIPIFVFRLIHMEFDCNLSQKCSEILSKSHLVGPSSRETSEHLLQITCITGLQQLWQEANHEEKEMNAFNGARHFRAEKKGAFNLRSPDKCSFKEEPLRKRVPFRDLDNRCKKRLNERSQARFSYQGHHYHCVHVCLYPSRERGTRGLKWLSNVPLHRVRRKGLGLPNTPIHGQLKSRQILTDNERDGVCSHSSS